MSMFLEMCPIPFVNARRYKHWGFAEESEVRVSAIPGSQQYDLAKKEGTVFRRKPVKHFLRKPRCCPYLNLLRGLRALPGNNYLSLVLSLGRILKRKMKPAFIESA